MQTNDYNPANQRLQSCKPAITILQTSDYNPAKKPAITILQTSDYNPANQRLQSCKPAITILQTSDYNNANQRLQFKIRLQTIQNIITKMLKKKKKKKKKNQLRKAYWKQLKKIVINFFCISTFVTRHIIMFV